MLPGVRRCQSLAALRGDDVFDGSSDRGLGEAGYSTPELPIQTIANAVAISIAGYLAVVERHTLLWGRDAAGVKAKRLGAVGDLLSAIKQPEHQIA